MKNIPNIIDKEFDSLVKYIKERTLKEVKDAIKINHSFLRKTEPQVYYSIAKYYNESNLWGQIDLDKEIYGLIDNNADTLVNHTDDLIWLYENLSDCKSKKILVNVLYYWLMLNYKKIRQLTDYTFSQYFDLDLIKCDKNEVFIDVGAYTGDTLLSYINTYGKDTYKKYYCYEVVPANIDIIKQTISKNDIKNAVIKEKGASNKKEVLYLENDEVSSISKLSEKGAIKVNTVKVDDDIKEDITFIKMDIEGGELEALLGCVDKISKNHPKLAISVYHKNDHLIKIPRIIHDIDPTYKFYLRYYGGPMLPTEYILYAI